MICSILPCKVWRSLIEKLSQRKEGPKETSMKVSAKAFAIKGLGSLIAKRPGNGKPDLLTIQIRSFVCLKLVSVYCIAYMQHKLSPPNDKWWMIQKAWHHVRRLSWALLQIPATSIMWLTGKLISFPVLFTAAGFCFLKVCIHQSWKGDVLSADGDVSFGIISRTLNHRDAM